jgi:protein required for attachment to host cells
MVPLATEQDPDGRLKASELTTDHLGHAAEDHRTGGTSFTPRTDPRRKKHQAFARSLSRRVDQALDSGAYGSLAVFASCPFLGELKGQLIPRARKALRVAIDSDLTSFPLGEVEDRVSSALHGPA